MQVKAAIDRFEGEQAVLLFAENNRQVIWPRALLPPGAAEGVIITVSLAVDEAATASARREVDDLFRRLLDKTKDP